MVSTGPKDTDRPCRVVSDSPHEAELTSVPQRKQLSGYFMPGLPGEGRSHDWSRAGRPPGNGSPPANPGKWSERAAMQLATRNSVNSADPAKCCRCVGPEDPRCPTPTRTNILTTPPLRHP